MKRPKLPKRVFFIDRQGIKLEPKKAWERLVKTLEVRITVGGIPRQYSWNGERPERVLFPEGIEVDFRDFRRFEEKLEEAVENFLELAFGYARQERFQKEKRNAIRGLRELPETNRIMSPTRFKTNPAQSRLNFRDSIPRPR